MMEHLTIAHLGKRGEEREGRLRPLVLVHSIGVHSIAAAARGGVVERLLQVILAEEPAERAACVRRPR